MGSALFKRLRTFLSGLLIREMQRDATFSGAFVKSLSFLLVTDLIAWITSFSHFRLRFLSVGMLEAE